MSKEAIRLDYFYQKIKISQTSFSQLDRGVTAAELNKNCLRLLHSFCHLQSVWNQFSCLKVWKVLQCLQAHHRGFFEKAQVVTCRFLRSPHCTQLRGAFRFRGRKQKGDRCSKSCIGRDRNNQGVSGIKFLVSSQGLLDPEKVLDPVLQLSQSLFQRFHLSISHLVLVNSDLDQSHVQGQNLL